MKLRGSYAAKISAIFLCFLSFVAVLCLAVCMLFTLASGLYTSSLRTVEKQKAVDYLDRHNSEVASCFLGRDYALSLQDLIDRYSYENYEFALYGAGGELLADTRHAEKSFADSEEAYYIGADFSMRVPLASEEEGVIRVCGQIPYPLTQEDSLYHTFRLLAAADRYRYVVPILFFAALTVNLLLFAFLMLSAGYRKNDETPRCCWADKIPFDLYAAFFLCLAVGQVVFLSGTSLSGWWSVALPALLLAVNQPLALAFCMSFATRAKTGTLIRNTLIARLFLLIFRALRAVPVVPKTIICLAVLFLYSVCVMVCGFFDGQLAAILFAAGWAVTAAAAVSYAAALKKLKTGAEKIASGDLQFQISTLMLTGDLRRHAETLNHIGQGLSREVEQRLKSERFKTELITNVSHDLKTPLTSIVSYIDLLGREPMESERARGYIQTLDRQARRLKKLTEDLVEASKAQTGNLRVEAVPCELGELFSQAVGEYQEKLDEAGLTAVATVPETPVRILADGRYLWRIFDNLLNNICKYSQSGTRVYLNLRELDGMAYVIFRNTSRYPLTATGEELTERFVRGDPSRHTEGSGLGLSIARSLVELQKGKMDVTVDGDLFKVTLTFRTID